MKTCFYLGRLDEFSSAAKQKISIFDPFLCEIIYQWFCPANGSVLDPFAGGSVRGIVASKTGHKYMGIELSDVQIKSNIEQALHITPNNSPQWIQGDSEEIIPTLNSEFDLIFSCPPYMQLEIYSDHPDDLSNMKDEDFILKYESIISLAIKRLKPEGYAVFVVSDMRDNNGFYKDLPSITKQAFYKTGMSLYNEIILVNPVGSGMLRCGFFEKNRKVVRRHQIVLVFKKGKE